MKGCIFDSITFIYEPMYLCITNIKEKINVLKTIQYDVTRILKCDR